MTVTLRLPIESGGPCAAVVGNVRTLSPTLPAGSVTPRLQVIVVPLVVQFVAPLPTSAMVAGIDGSGVAPFTLVT